MYWVCQSIVGLVLLYSGVLKALDAVRFGNHLSRFRLVPNRLLGGVAAAVAAAECGLGAALLLNLSPWLYPIGVLVFFSFLTLTLWGAARRHVSDCGCYGNAAITPAQSAALDLLYIGLLAAAWRMAPATPRPLLVPWALAPCTVGIGAGILGWKTRFSPLVDLSRLRPGLRWKNSWLQLSTPRDFASGHHFIVFLSPDCGACKRWVPLLNVLDAQQDLPAVTGITTLNEQEMGAFSARHSIGFSLARMRENLFGTMADAFPTAALIVDGVVKQKWIGQFPAEYASRIERFLEQVAFKAKPKPQARFGG